MSAGSLPGAAESDQCEVTVCRAATGALQTFTLRTGGVLRIGRGVANDIVLDLLGVSVYHAELYLRPAGPGDPGKPGHQLLCIRDESKNGTGVRPGPHAPNQDVLNPARDWEPLKKGALRVIEHGWQVIAPMRSRKENCQLPEAWRVLTVYMGSKAGPLGDEELDGELWEPATVLPEVKPVRSLSGPVPPPPPDLGGGAFEEAPPPPPLPPPGGNAAVQGHLAARDQWLTQAGRKTQERQTKEREFWEQEAKDREARAAEDKDGKDRKRDKKDRKEREKREREEEERNEREREKKDKKTKKKDKEKLREQEERERQEREEREREEQRLKEKEDKKKDKKDKKAKKREEKEREEKALKERQAKEREDAEREERERKELEATGDAADPEVEERKKREKDQWERRKREREERERLERELEDEIAEELFRKGRPKKKENAEEEAEEVPPAQDQALQVQKEGGESATRQSEDVPQAAGAPSAAPLDVPAAVEVLESTGSAGGANGIFLRCGFHLGRPMYRRLKDEKDSVYLYFWDGEGDKKSSGWYIAISLERKSSDEFLEFWTTESGLPALGEGSFKGRMEIRAQLDGPALAALAELPEALRSEMRAAFTAATAPVAEEQKPKIPGVPEEEVTEAVAPAADTADAAAPGAEESGKPQAMDTSEDVPTPAKPSGDAQPAAGTDVPMEDAQTPPPGADSSSKQPAAGSEDAAAEGEAAAKQGAEDAAMDVDTPAPESAAAAGVVVAPESASKDVQMEPSAEEKASGDVVTKAQQDEDAVEGAGKDALAEQKDKPAGAPRDASSEPANEGSEAPGDVTTHPAQTAHTAAATRDSPTRGASPQSSACSETTAPVRTMGAETEAEDAKPTGLTAEALAAHTKALAAAQAKAYAATFARARSGYSRSIAGKSIAGRSVAGRSLAGKSIAGSGIMGSERTFRTHMTTRELLVGASVMRELMRSVSPISTPGVNVRRRKKSPTRDNSETLVRDGTPRRKKRKEKKEKKDKAGKLKISKKGKTGRGSPARYVPPSPTPYRTEPSTTPFAPVDPSKEPSAVPSHWKSNDPSTTPAPPCPSVSVDSVNAATSAAARPKKNPRPGNDRWAPSPCSSAAKSDQEDQSPVRKKRKKKGLPGKEPRERGRSTDPKKRPKEGKRRRKSQSAKRKRKRSPP